MLGGRACARRCAAKYIKKHCRVLLPDLDIICSHRSICSAGEQVALLDAVQIQPCNAASVHAIYSLVSAKNKRSCSAYKTSSQHWVYR